MSGLFCSWMSNEILRLNARKNAMLSCQDSVDMEIIDSDLGAVKAGCSSHIQLPDPAGCMRQRDAEEGRRHDVQVG